MPLNQPLYDGLLAAARRGQMGHSRKVVVIRPGQPNRFVYKDDPLAPDTRADRRRVEFDRSGEGEAYLVCCPHCRDRRYRLSINHAWGVKDKTLDVQVRFPVHCFNENCESRVEGFHRELENALSTYALRGGHVKLEAGWNMPKEKMQIRPPGPCVSIAQLPTTHHAVQWLVRNGHDPLKLAAQFGVSFCLQSVYSFARERLIFPVTANGEMVGWQARYVGDGDGDVFGLWRCRDCQDYSRHVAVDQNTGKRVQPSLENCPKCGSENVLRVPKYWTCPGMPTSETLYNYDAARRWPFVVITEGPRDPISLGTPTERDAAGPGVCLFGHKLGDVQKKLLFDGWRHGAAVVMLDGDVPTAGPVVVNKLDSLFAHGVCGVTLPTVVDPGGCEHSLLWSRIREAAREKGVHLGI